MTAGSPHSLRLTEYVKGDGHSAFFTPLRALDPQVGLTATVLEERGSS